MVGDNVDSDRPLQTDPVYGRQIGGAILCINRHDMDGATDACGAAVQHNPDGCEAYFLFSVVAFLLEDLGRAIEFAQKGHELDPNCAEGCDILAHIHAYAGNLNDSVYFAKLATAGESSPLLVSLKVDGLDDLAKALNRAEQVSYQVEALRAFYEEDFDTAVTACEKELRLRPGDHEIFLLYGRCLLGQGHISRGIAAIHGALHLIPDDWETSLRLGEGYMLRGERELARTCFQRALDLSGKSDEALSVISRYRHLMDMAWPEFDKACRAWFKGTQQNRSRDKSASESDDDVVRVGLLVDRACSSEELRYLEPWFWQFDRNRIELYVYSVDRPGDKAPEKLRSLTKLWVDVSEIKQDKLLNVMREHALDILVDVCVKERRHHSSIIAAHPARHVVRWNAPSGGMRSFGYDAVICDGAVKNKTTGGHGKIVSRAAAVSLSRENLPRIDGMSPVQTLGHVTFGATCDLARVTPDVAMVWSQILRKVPGSRLLLGNVAVIPPDVKSRFQEMFSACGCVGHIDFAPLASVAAENILVSRLEFVVSTDIYLDAFPHGGTIELADALWSGVPVIGHTKKEEPGSLGNALLRAGGQERWLAKNDAAYISLGVEVAGAVTGDPEWRANMHEAVRKSALFDPDGWGTALNECLFDIARS